MPNYIADPKSLRNRRTYGAVKHQVKQVASFFFTAPWEPTPVRRGDALGLAALADQFADAVAPDFSNRIRDGRWVTILAWCLVQSQQVFHASGGRAVLTRQEQYQRYAWLRPLELMWVARTITLLDKEDWKQRSLPGQRRVAPWVENQSMDRFGMFPSQFRAYRQTGNYGGYRRGFRKWPGLTSGDGWTPGPQALALAKWLDGRLKGASLTLGDEIGRSAKLWRGKEHDWWLKRWPQFAETGKDADLNTLPRQRTDFSVLPEALILKPIVFGSDPRGKKRMAVVQSIQRSTATNHVELCQYLSVQFKDDPTIARLDAFSRLADAGVAAMDLVAQVLHGQPEVTLNEVAQHQRAGSVCKELRAATRAWLAAPDIQLRHIDAARRFAEAITADQPVDCFRQVLLHHKTYGGGLHWFVLDNNRIQAHTPPIGVASRYGFRLWPLCRLATQCGVLETMPTALLDDAAYLDDEDNE